MKCTMPSGCHNPNRCGDNGVCYYQATVDTYKARENAAAEATAGFHWRDGWYFRRLEDGSVRIVSDYADLTIPAAEWASIVCSVSADGETGERWHAAQDFHGRKS